VTKAFGIGWDPTQSNKFFDEVWVLSLPSFTWLQIYNGSSPRYGHSCHIVGNRQMITVGGRTSANATETCDFEYMSVAIYDLTEGNSDGWGSVYTADKPPYQVNAQISAAIGGGANGNATKLLPDGGWSSSSVANLFTGTSNQSAPAIISSSTTSSLSNSSASLPLPSPPSSSSPGKNAQRTIIGAIAGGVVGGIGLVSLVFGLTYLASRHSKSRRISSWDTQGQYQMPEMDGEGKHLETVNGETTELPESRHQTCAEIAGNARCELPAGDQLPIEVEG